MEEIIALNKENIDNEHICCAFSDKKCQESYMLKKMWLKKQFDHGYTFKRIDARAKVFIEYGPAEYSWNPITAPNYLAINCLWVSGQYKEKGYGKQLLQHAIDDAKALHKSGLVTIVGTQKFHFMSDTKWLLKQGFVNCDTTSTGFSLLTLKFGKNAPSPYFNTEAKLGICNEKKGIVVYYSNRCAFTDYHVNYSLKETAKKRKLPLTIIKLETNEQAQASPCPATIFGLYFNGSFVTTDLSICMDSRFDKITGFRQ